jgi:hypothetical protein
MNFFMGKGILIQCAADFTFDRKIPHRPRGNIHGAGRMDETEALRRTSLN